MLRVLAWWVALTAAWLLTTSTVDIAELVAAAVAAVPCAVIAPFAGRALGGVEKPRASWLRWFLPVPRAVTTETVRALRTRETGHFETLRLPADRIAARQAVATVAIGLSPGAMVADVPPGGRTVVVHRLLPGASAVLEKIRR
ncbi:hypothetical protein [Amycolatopsis sp. NPDC059021]|uniref:hypothetical protein n=1 Tax=Amycolatopsis sp. NPDC059021 TaxID=3346704 RepID=UPI00366E76DF